MSEGDGVRVQRLRENGILNARVENGVPVCEYMMYMTCMMYVYLMSSSLSQLHYQRIGIFRYMSAPRLTQRAPATGSMSKVVISGSLGGVRVRTLAHNARDVESIPTLGAIFLMFITPNDTGFLDHDPAQGMLCMVVEPILCTGVTGSIKSLDLYM